MVSILSLEYFGIQKYSKTSPNHYPSTTMQDCCYDLFVLVRMLQSFLCLFGFCICFCFFQIWSYAWCPEISIFILSVQNTLIQQSCSLLRRSIANLTCADLRFFLGRRGLFLATLPNKRHVVRSFLIVLNFNTVFFPFPCVLHSLTRDEIIPLLGGLQHCVQRCLNAPDQQTA